MRLITPIPNNKKMSTQRIPLGQIFKIELTPRAELQRRISENSHKTFIIQHQHEGKVEKSTVTKDRDLHRQSEDVKKPLDVKFNLTPLGFTTKHQRERQKKTEWIKRMTDRMNIEAQYSTQATWYDIKRVIKGTLLQVDMYITSTDMDNNKDCIKLITNKDQEAIDTIWNLAQNTTAKLNEKKKIWIPALGQAMEREYDINTEDDRQWKENMTSTQKIGLITHEHGTDP